MSLDLKELAANLRSEGERMIAAANELDPPKRKRRGRPPQSESSPSSDASAATSGDGNSNEI